MAQEIIFRIFPFSRNMVFKCGGGGVLASREASANFFRGVLREIWLVLDLWALHGLLRYATDDHPQTTSEK